MLISKPCSNSSTPPTCISIAPSWALIGTRERGCAIRATTRRAFEKLIKLAIDEQLKFVILAGDIYDGKWLDYNTGLFFVKQVRELEKARIPVVLIRGNHDAGSRITSHLTLPPNVHELPTEPHPDTIRFDKLGVAVHGQGYAHQAETRNIAADYPPPVSGYFNIGVLHTGSGWARRTSALRAMSCRGTDRARLSVLGSGTCPQARKRVCGRPLYHEFPGNIQGRKIDEPGAKGCLLVTVDNAGRSGGRVPCPGCVSLGESCCRWCGGLVYCGRGGHCRQDD